MNSNTLSSRGFRPRSMRCAVSARREVRDFLAPHLVDKGITGDDLAEALAIINDAARADGFFTHPALTAYQALGRIQSCAVARREVAAWVGIDASILWPGMPLAPYERPYQRLNGGGFILPGELFDAGFRLPDDKPLLGFLGVDRLDAWREWSLIKVVADFIWLNQVDVPFYPARKKWKKRVVEYSGCRDLDHAFSTLKEVRGSRELIAKWLGYLPEVIWPDHNETESGRLTAPLKRLLPVPRYESILAERGMGRSAHQLAEAGFDASRREDRA